MNKLEIESNKAEFISLLKSTGREGIDDLIDMLDDGKMRFFTAPASVNHHLNSDGGLLQHSLNTCKAGLKLREMVISLKPELEHKLSRESVIVATLLHDICKADIYVPTLKKRKGEDGLWREVESYDINYRNFPMGHGEKSVIRLLRLGLEMTDEEMLAIRWHMSAFDMSDSPEARGNYTAAGDKSPLVTLISCADTLASHLVETRS